ncbi:MAG: carboxypeptidase regulatory-like domain-containing protein [bacterium]|nr:carboxypeptidase regulatory-like domain-containing protein [bacterium]
MNRTAAALLLIVLALAAGAYWIAAGTGVRESEDALLAGEQKTLTPGEAPPADLARLPARQEDPDPGRADPTSPAEERAQPESTERRRAVPGEKLHALRFRLEDDRGEPIQNARLSFGNREGEAEVREIVRCRGDYRLTELAAGEYVVRVEAYDHDADAEPATHVVPGNGEPILLTFARRGSIDGRVVDEVGQGLRELRIVLAAEKDTSDTTDTTESAEEGAFAFASVPAGPVTLRVSNGFVSAEAELVLEPGEALEGYELRLEGGGTVQGVVLDAGGQPVPGVDVLVTEGAEIPGKSKTDEAGAFRIGPIPPGTYQVATVLKEDAGSSVFDQLISETVTVARGEVIDLVLQPKQAAPIRVVGTVTLAGEPLDDCTVYAFREDESLLEAVRMGRTDEEGAYELTLGGGPGPYLFLFEPKQNKSNRPTAPQRFDIPDANEVRIDLAVPAGAIAGTVFGTDGEPRGGVKIVAVPSDGYMDIQLPDANRGIVATSKGGFRIPFLVPGDYVLRAHAIDGSPASWEPLDGVRVSVDEVTSGVELHASAGGTVRGVVAGPGGPVPGATVYVRGADKRLLFLSGAVTDASGEFEIAGVGEGDVSVSARADGLASAESEAKRVDAGRETSFRVRLRPGSLLTVVANESCAIHVLDAKGRDVTAVMTAARAKGNFQDPLSTTTKTVGPLPAGEYEAVATTRAGKRTARRVKVNGKRDATVELEL